MWLPSANIAVYLFCLRMSRKRYSGQRSTKGGCHGSHQVWTGISGSFFVRDPGPVYRLLQDKREDPDEKNEVGKSGVELFSLRLCAEA